jgi:hypothetical protein
MESAIYEAHMAIPKVSHETARELLGELKQIGVKDSDYFLRLVNLPYDGQPCQIDPTTHDIDEPMIITSTFFTNYQRAVKTIREGMGVLERHGVHTGNFELESVLDEEVHKNGTPSISDFPGFSQQDGAPKYENHIIWRGPGDTLPIDEDIVRYHKTVFGYSPNQIADFCLNPTPAQDETVWRVSTVYQPTREETLQFARQVHENIGQFPQAREVISEKICVVSEPKRT